MKFVKDLILNVSFFNYVDLRATGLIGEMRVQRSTDAPGRERNLATVLNLNVFYSDEMTG